MDYGAIASSFASSPSKKFQPVGYGMMPAQDLWGDGFGAPQLTTYTPMMAKASQGNGWDEIFKKRGQLNGDYSVAPPTQAYAPAWQPMGFSNVTSIRPMGSYSPAFTPMQYGY